MGLALILQGKKILILKKNLKKFKLQTPMQHTILKPESGSPTDLSALLPTPNWPRKHITVTSCQGRAVFVSSLWHSTLDIAGGIETYPVGPGRVLGLNDRAIHLA